MMHGPMAHPPTTVTNEVTCLGSTLPVRGLGHLPVNCHLIEAAQPVLIDTGLPALADVTVANLATIIDPIDLRWIWLTHCDADHVGALPILLQLAPQARIVTNFLGMGKLGMRLEIAPERFFLLNPGQQLDLGDRRLVAFTPPTYDAPETMGAFDPVSRVLFSSDCFGAVLPEPVEDAAAVDPVVRATGLATWTTVDAPWIADIEVRALTRAIGVVRDFGAKVVASAHLPPARGMLDALVTDLAAARRADRFVGPDQRELEAMLAAKPDSSEE